MMLDLKILGTWLQRRSVLVLGEFANKAALEKLLGVTLLGLGRGSVLSCTFIDLLEKVSWT